MLFRSHKLRKQLDEGIEAAMEYAEVHVNTIKKQFKMFFDELDEMIRQKYSELEKYVNEQKDNEEEVEKNKKLLAWIEDCEAKIDDILNI